ncbi:MAG: glycosyltransferase, partial [Thermoguttaceae bacterium]
MAITTVPIVADLIDRLPVHHWVYYCVDDFSRWPGLDQATIEKMEEQMVRRGDVLIAASERLQERLAERGRNSFLLTHGVDLGLWQKGLSATATILDGIERPVVLFWGSVDWQMDLSFLRRLAADLSRGTIVLVGPRTDADPSLLTIPRVVWKPKVPYEQLPALAKEASVLIMPYLDGPGLQESQPLKLKEYLASGKPAVVRDLPANRVWADALDLARTPEEFSEAVRRRLAEGLPTSQAAARQRLAGESWDDK